MRATFKKNERLCKKSDFQKLFNEGKTIVFFPIKAHYLFIDSQSTTSEVKVAFSVSSKRIKTAVERNYIKRIMREAYRKNKHIIIKNLKKNNIFIAFIYLTEEKYTYANLEKTLCLTLQAISEKYLQHNEKNEIIHNDTNNNC
jgi:ribonuclease P protein component